MEKGTKISLAVSGLGFLLKEYERKKISQPNFYETHTPSKPLSEDQLKMLGGVAFIGGLASAGIFEATKNSPKARKLSFIGLGGLGVLGFLSILYALKKMS